MVFRCGNNLSFFKVLTWRTSRFSLRRRITLSSRWIASLSLRDFFSKMTWLRLHKNSCVPLQSQIDPLGNQTMNENIADNGGIKLAYEAYKTLIGQEGSEGALPALGLTEDQLFFVGFARPWCSIYKKKAALHQLAIDTHTFPQYRVIGTLQNYDKFAEAFKCQPGSPMNPRRKCSLW